MPDNEFRLRRQTIWDQLSPQPADAFLITHLPNIRYLSGFTGSNAALLLHSRAAELFTDPRYTIQAAAETSCKVRIAKGPILPALLQRIAKLKIRRIGFEPSHIGYYAWSFLRDGLPAKSELIPIKDLLETVRSTKSPAEINLLRQALRTNSRALDAALKKLRPTMQERDLAAELEYQMRRLGGEGPSFETIVAAGPRAARPHARPSSEVIAGHPLLLIDMGTTQDGYTSDMTRTFFLGSATAKWKRAYRGVLEAQLAAIDAIGPGVPSERPDRAARVVLRSYGLDKQFTHSTGHGLGLEIHEVPRLGKRDKAILRAGMVVTVEPGIYLEGQGGIRIEDMVLVTDSGREVLTPTPKDLTVL